MSRPVVTVALDLGTTAAKAALFDARGRRLALFRQPLSIRSLPGGGFEQDAEEFVQAARRLLGQVASELTGRTRVACVGIASQRAAVVVWERPGGRARGPVVSWMDRRGAGLIERLSSRAGEIDRRTGLRTSPHYGAAHLARRLRSEPALARSARRGEVVAGPVGAFVLARLGRGNPVACDPTLAQRTLLYDPRRGGWDRTLCRLFRIPISLLPDVRPTAGVWGEMPLGRRTAPVVAICGDQQAAGAAFDLDAESLLVHYGTGAFTLWPARRARQPAGLLLSLRADRAGRFYVEGTVNSAGTALDAVAGWIGREELDGSLGSLNRRARNGPQGEEALLVPAFAGLGAPHWVPDARAVLFGAEAIRSPDDIVLAALQGIAHRVADIIEAGRGSRRGRGGIIASGPLAAYRALMRAQAEAARLPVRVAREREATLRGIARIGLREAAGHDLPPVPLGQPVHPGSSRATHARRRRVWRMALAAATGR
jgi:glycerol kinase